MRRLHGVLMVLGVATGMAALAAVLAVTWPRYETMVVAHPAVQVERAAPPALGWKSVEFAKLGDLLAALNRMPPDRAVEAKVVLTIREHFLSSSVKRDVWTLIYRE